MQPKHRGRSCTKPSVAIYILIVSIRWWGGVHTGNVFSCAVPSSEHYTVIATSNTSALHLFACWMLSFPTASAASLLTKHITTVKLARWGISLIDHSPFLRVCVCTCVHACLGACICIFITLKFHITIYISSNFTQPSIISCTPGHKHTPPCLTCTYFVCTKHFQ